MGKASRAHREAVIAGTELPWRQTGERWVKFTPDKRKTTYNRQSARSGLKVAIRLTRKEEIVAARAARQQVTAQANPIALESSS
jgi:hypothetical protein